MRANLKAYGGPVMMIAITPPGVERLPWACPRDHDHSGPRGCQIDEFAADEWALAAPKRWSELRQAARVATLRAVGFKPTLLERVWEPQKRGVPHLHIVLGMGSEPEKIAAHRFLDELQRLAGEYDFGFVQLHRKEMGPADCARYLVGYLLGRSKHKGTIRDNIAHPRMPRSLIWVTPKLTSETLVTMRRMRYVRWAMAALDGRCSILPSLRGQMLVDVAQLLVVFYRRGRSREEDDDERDRHFQRFCSLLRAMRRAADLQPMPAAA